MYARVLGQGEGLLVMEDLVKRFGGSLFVRGGEDGRRQTDFRLGRRELLDFMLAMAHPDREDDPPEEDDSNPAA